MKFSLFAYLLGFATANIIQLKDAEIAAEGQNPISNVYTVELYSNTQARADTDEIIRSRKIELDGDGKKSQETFHSSKEVEKYLSFYKSLLDRISANALTVKNSKDKKVLGYLYTATLGKIYNLEDHLESTVVNNITNYFDSVIYDIETLKDLQNEKVRKDITNKYKQQYRNVINSKILLAKEVISKEILPEVDYIKTELDNQIENLISEVIDLQNQNIKDNDAIREKQKKLETAIMSQGFLGPLKSFGQAASFIGRAGEVAGSAIEFGSSLAETIILNIPRTENMDQSLTDLKSLQDQISKFGDQKINGLKNVLEIVSQEINKYPTVLGAISAKVSDIRSKLDAVVKNKLNIKEVQGLEIELKTILQTQRNETIKSEKDANNEKTKTAVAVIDNLLKLFQMSSVLVDTIKKYEESSGKLVEIRKAVQQNEQKIGMFKEYEDKICTTMVALLEIVKNDLDNIISKILNNEKVVFDVATWKVKNTLNDLKLQLQQVTEGFGVEGSLELYLVKLQDTLFALIKMQDYLEDYQKHKILANFIAGVTSVTINDADVSHGPMLKGDLRDLETTIRANIVMQRYKVGIDAFKQFVFPFASIYLGSPRLPIVFKVGESILDNAIQAAKSHFRQIERDLRYEKAVLTRTDACKYSGSFYGDRRFFTWKKQTNQYMFSKLLSGKEVIVKAEAEKLRSDSDGIKFSLVEFKFKTVNADMQVKINNALKGFHIRATYLGDSYYRYKDQIYLMTPASNYSFLYSFDKRTDRTPVTYTASFYRFKHADPILSPYATWKIKLLEATDKFSFKDLEILKNQPDLELILEGEARYLLAVGACGDLNVDDYYKAIK